MSSAVWGTVKIHGGKQPHVQPIKSPKRPSRSEPHQQQQKQKQSHADERKMSTAVWGSLKIKSGGSGNQAHVQVAPPGQMRFTESLNAALGNRKARYKDVSKDLNNLITKEEETAVIAAPPYNVDRLKRAMQKIIRQQFILKDEDGDPIKWKYDPEKNLELGQKIAKTIQDKLKAFNYSRYRIVSICSIVEKQGQGISYKMKYIIDPYLDNYVQYVHDMAHFWIIATVFLVHKD